MSGSLRISIAIPTYRRPAYLKEALESIDREQGSFPGDLELVISDNASNDETEQVAASFESVNVEYVCNDENLGAAENIIRACERCTGDYVFILGDDDILEPGSLERVARVADSSPRPGVITGPVTHFRDGQKTQTGKVSFANERGHDRILDPGPGALEETFLRATMMSGLVIRRDLLDSDGARRHADSLYPQMYLAGLAGREAGAAYLSDPIVSVREGPASEWSYSGDFMAAGVFAILDDLTDGRDWGAGVRRRVSKRRVRATFSPLYEARGESFRAYLKTVFGLASVSQYQRSPYFWVMAISMGILGTRGIGLVKNVIRPRGSDRVG